MLDREDLYKKCVEFHGHSCGGLLVGFRAALCAMERFGLDGRAQDEELVCVAENDACGVDAIQALLGCTAGKGNLIFRLRGKQAFTFYDRKSGESFRISPEKSGIRRQRVETRLHGERGLGGNFRLRRSAVPASKRS